MKLKPTVSEDWIKSPIRSAIGTIWLAGYLRNNSTIPPDKMRILGRYAVVIILEGQVYYQDALGRQADLSEGDLILVTPTLAHAYGSKDGQIWAQSYVVFDGPQFDLLQQAEPFLARRPFWNLKSIHSWKHRLEEALKEPADAPANHGIRTLGHFVYLLIEMAAEEEATSKVEETWLKNSIQLLGEPRETGWASPQQVAFTVGLSYENFRKLFTRRMGNPPAKFQLQRKIDRACAAIYQGSINFKELAEELEFCDVYHFSKAFRQVRGVPPSSYRRSVRGE